MTLRLPNRVRRIISSFANVFGGDIIYGIHDEIHTTVVFLGAGHSPRDGVLRGVRDAGFEPATCRRGDRF
jgi:hypothetical protein